MTDEVANDDSVTDEFVLRYRDPKFIAFHQKCLAIPLDELGSMGLDSDDIQSVKMIREQLANADLGEEILALAKQAHDQFVAGPTARAIDLQEAATVAREMSKKEQVDVVSKGIIRASIRIGLVALGLWALYSFFK